MAIEDAACLTKCLQASPDMASGFRAYESMREARTAHISRQARRIGAIGQWESPWIVRGRDLITRLVLSHLPGTRLRAVYAYEV
jgi:2-polyprenyl-6-methoxyphenol hydroxylase-like FAD-dependent oxidoreductase